MKAVAALVTAASFLCPLAVVGQSAIHIGLIVERVGLSGFQDTSTQQTSLLLGGSLGGRHGLEVNVGQLEGTQTDGDWSPSDGEAPYTVGVSAHPVQLSYVLTVPLGAFPLRPFVRIGGDWARLTDTYRSDTPEERQTTSLWGAHSGAGLSAAVGSHAWISLCGEYRSFHEDGTRPPLALGLSGWTLRGALGISL